METNIYKKLAEVKAKIGKLTKDTANPFFKSKYADINQLIEMTDPVLLEAGLIVLQPIVDGYLTTKIVDIESGESIDSSLKLPELNDAQKVGSAITYFRRYTLKSLLNIQEEDDDANKAAGNTSQKQVKNTPAPATKTATKTDLHPGLKDKWDGAVKYIKEFDGIVFDALDAIKKKYNLTDQFEKQLIKEATGVDPDETDPVESIDALKAADSMAILNKVFNDCSALHTNKAFVDAYAARQKELAKLGKAA